MENQVYNQPLSAARPVSDLRACGDADYDLQRRREIYNKLIERLNASVMEAEENGWIPEEEVWKELGIE